MYSTRKTACIHLLKYHATLKYLLFLSVKQDCLTAVVLSKALTCTRQYLQRSKLPLPIIHFDTGALACVQPSRSPQKNRGRDFFEGSGTAVHRLLARTLFKITFQIGQPFSKHLGPVVRSVDNAIHRINRYPADKCWQDKLRYPLDSDLSGG